MFRDIKNEIKAKEEELEIIRERYTTLNMISAILKPSIAQIISDKDSSLPVSAIDSISNEIIEGFFENRKEVSLDNASTYIKSLDLLILESGINIEMKIRERELFLKLLSL